MSVIDPSDMKSFSPLSLEESGFQSQGFVCLKKDNEYVIKTIDIKNITRVYGTNIVVGDYAEIGFERITVKYLPLFFQKNFSYLKNFKMEEKEYVEPKGSFFSPDFYSCFYPTNNLNTIFIGKTPQEAIEIFEKYGDDVYEMLK